MIYLKKFITLWKFNILKVNSYYGSFPKHLTTQMLKDQNAANKSANQKKRKKKLITPPMTEEKIKALNNITSFAVQMNYVSWAKISMLDFSLLEWDAFELPKNFSYSTNEFEILNLVSLVQQKIPNSDLFVTEKHNCFRKKFSELYLKIALMVYLGNFNEALEINEKIVIQHPAVLNNTYKLEVGSERRTTKPIVENIFSLQKDQSFNNAPSTYSFIKISKEMIQNFDNYNRTKQESLSLALLINLSFLHLNFFENQENFTDSNLFDCSRFN